MQIFLLTKICRVSEFVLTKCDVYGNFCWFGRWFDVVVTDQGCPIRVSVNCTECIWSTLYASQSFCVAQVLIQFVVVLRLLL
jgi:hypothetical protein